MAERKRSNDKTQDTERVFGQGGAAHQQGRAGGTLQRDIASEDEMKRATERPAGKTRVRKSHKKEADDA